MPVSAEPSDSPEVTQPIRKLRRQIELPPPEPPPAVILPEVISSPVPREPDAVCPRCAIRLIDPNGMGVCPVCGYCRSLDRDAVKVADQDTQPQHGMGDGLWMLFGMLRRMPGWIPVLIAGAIGVILVSFAIDHQLPHHHASRKYYSTVQLGSGFLMLYLAQWWVLGILAPKENDLTGNELFVISGKLWSKALHHMPATRWPVYIGCWSLVAMVCSVTIVGGLSDWLEPEQEPTQGMKIMSLDELKK